MRSLILAAVLAVAADAWGCSCATLTPAEQFGYAQLVFVGEVIDVDDRFSYLRQIWTTLLYAIGREPDADYGIEYTFEVEQIWRGPGSRTIRVLSGRGGSDCGYRFAQGKRYLVYGFKGSNGVWQTGICTRTRLAGASAAEDLAFLKTVR